MDTLNLPVPSNEALWTSSKLQSLIRDEIVNNDGWIAFSKFMEMALYTPHYGYYTAKVDKIGTYGDFITAPTISSLYGKTLAVQIKSIVANCSKNIYEIGAGTGELAITLLEELGDAIDHYYILEISPELRGRQYEAIHTKTGQLVEKVIFLDGLPETIDGIVIGNEVLDAMPTELATFQNGNYFRLGVSYDQNNFMFKKNK